MDKPKYPTFFEQIKNLSALAGGVSKDLLQNQEVFVPEEKQTERLNICATCEHYESNDKRCKLCGCFMEAKVKFVSSSCPVLKW